MSTITVRDDTTIYFKDGGTGAVVTFSHGFASNARSESGRPAPEL
jgi:non-heme chloroperoxidase